MACSKPLALSPSFANFVDAIKLKQAEERISINETIEKDIYNLDLFLRRKRGTFQKKNIFAMDTKTLRFSNRGPSKRNC